MIGPTPVQRDISRDAAWEPHRNPCALADRAEMQRPAEEADAATRPRAAPRHPPVHGALKHVVAGPAPPMGRRVAHEPQPNPTQPQSRLSRFLAFPRWACYKLSLTCTAAPFGTVVLHTARTPLRSAWNTFFGPPPATSRCHK